MHEASGSLANLGEEAGEIDKKLEGSGSIKEPRVSRSSLEMIVNVKAIYKDRVASRTMASVYINNQLVDENRSSFLITDNQNNSTSLCYSRTTAFNPL